jgi:peptidoglycan/LPS O-acetylase OafA/YrhL
MEQADMKLLATLRSGPAGPRTRLDGIDELKGVGLILVLVYHCGGVLNLPNHWHGEVGVDVFLLISGFLCALAPPEAPWMDFVRRRFLRIYPSYWLALGLFILMAGVLLGHTYAWKDLALDGAGLDALWHGAYFSNVNDSFWFITTIVILYLVYLGIRRWSRDVMVVLGIGGLATALAWLPYPGFDHLAGRLPGFFIGAAVGQMVRSGEIRWRGGWVLAAGALVAGWLGVNHAIELGYPVAAIGVAALVLGGRGVVAASAVGRSALAPLRWLGLYSYEIYLLHQPLIRDYNPWCYQHLLGREPSHGDLAWGIAIALALTLLLARGVAAVGRRPRLRAVALAAAAAALIAVGAGAGPGLARMLHASALPEYLHRAPARADLGGWCGPLRVELELPEPVRGPSAPVVVTGINGQADLLGVIRVDATHVRLTLDHWGAYALTSPTLLLTGGPSHRVEVAMGSLLPPPKDGFYATRAGLLPWTHRLLVRFDGQVGFDRTTDFYPAAADHAVVGYNGPGGSTTGELYSGRILAVGPWAPPGWPPAPALPPAMPPTSSPATPASR